MYPARLQLFRFNFWLTASVLRNLPALFVLAVAFLVVLEKARAVDPPPDGGYPNYNTAEGDNTLFSLSGGNNNTALGSNALLSVTNGSGNTAASPAALA